MAADKPRSTAVLKAAEAWITIESYKRNTMATAHTDDQPALREFPEVRETAIRERPVHRCGLLSLVCIWLAMAVVGLGTLVCLWEAVKAIFSLDPVRLCLSLLAAASCHGIYSALGLASDYGSGKR